MNLARAIPSHDSEPERIGGDLIAPSSIVPLVLVAQGSGNMRKYLRSELSDQHFRVVDADTGLQALAQARRHSPDLVLLDFALPDLDAVRVTTELREWTAAPIIVLSVHDEEREKVMALDAGANDFLTQPFSIGELLARMRVWLRHTRRVDCEALKPALEVGDLKVDFVRRLAFVRGQEIRLTPTQHKVFSVMMRNAGKVLTHQQILSLVWGPERTKEIHYLRVYMGKLRRKFGEDPEHPRYFITESGIGYRLQT